MSPEFPEVSPEFRCSQTNTAPTQKTKGVVHEALDSENSGMTWRIKPTMPMIIMKTPNNNTDEPSSLQAVLVPHEPSFPIAPNKMIIPNKIRKNGSAHFGRCLPFPNALYESRQIKYPYIKIGIPEITYAESPAVNAI